ncbi:MAG: leucine-rich repeat domain-containing protein [Clostridiales bacterium]|jgi:hypothetical protein|nr:leucine-rich repeat domain-containing protein [Clostridiales bacterium]
MKDITPDCDFMISKAKVLTGYKWHPNSYGSQNPVFLPNEIEEIGFRAMLHFICPRLVMPRSLKVIRLEAFALAHIDEIDFNGCNLLTIDCDAFVGCKAKTTLPDSVRHIESKAIQELELKKGEKLRLPSSLNYIGRQAIDLRGLRILEVEEAMVTQQSGLEELIVNTYDLNKEGLILYVRRNGKLIFRVPFSFYYGYIKPGTPFISEKGINYSFYDEWFSISSDRQLKSMIAAFRFMFTEGLTAEAIKKYKKYASSNFPALIDGFEEDIEVIKLYDDAGIISVNRLKQLLENASKKNNVEAAAGILELMNRREGSTVKSLRL